MAITFGSDLQDVTADEAELRQLLDGAAPQDGDGDEGLEELAADPDPGWEQPGLGERLLGAAKSGGTKAGQAPPRKVSSAVKRDVTGKVALMTQMLAGAWQVRDPLCGGAAVQAVPEFSEALADILCDSPDIVNWFTSGGSYMKWLTLLMTVQPVLAVAVQHHVIHTIGVDEDPAQQQDWTGYAAG